MTDRFYAACLASYNNGVLHGAWIDASTDADDMQDRVNAILRASKFPNVLVKVATNYEVTCAVLQITNNVNHPYMSCIDGRPLEYVRIPVWIEGAYRSIPSAEDWAIHDHEGEALAGCLEYEGLQGIADRMRLAELAEDQFGANGLAIFNAYADNIGRDYASKDHAEAIEQCQESFLGVYASVEDYAAQTVEDSGQLADVPENLRNYIDYDAMARDMVLGGDIWVHEVSYKTVWIFSNR